MYSMHVCVGKRQSWVCLRDVQRPIGAPRPPTKPKPCRRALSQRVAQCLRREEAEHDELGSQVKQLQLAVREAGARVRRDGEDGAAQMLLEQAAGVLSGQGPGGDL